MLDSAIRRFIDVVDLHRRWQMNLKVTYYQVGKLAFNLLPISLSMISTLEGLGMQVILTLLQSHPPFRLIQNDPLELEKVKVAQAIEEFLKV